jgi:hypothetical protein
MYALRGSSTKTFFRFDTLANSWCQRADAPAKTGLGAGMVYGGGSWLYALRGDRKTDFWRYHTVNNAWESRASLPGAAQDGAALVWTGGDYIYCLRGDNKTEFYRYQISANQWTSLSPVPVTVDYGGSLCFDPLTNRLYCLPGRGRLCFYTYNIASGNWSSRQPIPRQISGGSALAWCDHSVYAVLGGHGPANFQRYSPPAGGDWDFGYAPDKPNPAPLFVPGFLGGKDEDLFPTDEEGIAAPANPVYTPDGSSIIFVAYDSTNGRMGLYRKPVEGGDAVLLTDDSVSYSKPACNSDGSSIAAAGDSGLYLVSPDDGTSVKVADGIVDAPRWLPGDTMLMYEKWDDNRETHTVHLVRPDGTEDTCLTGEADYFAPQPLFQGGFVCARQKGELGQLGKMDQDGNEDWLTSDYCEKRLSDRLTRRQLRRLSEARRDPALADLRDEPG